MFLSPRNFSLVCSMNSNSILMVNYVYGMSNSYVLRVIQDGSVLFFHTASLQAYSRSPTFLNAVFVASSPEAFFTSSRCQDASNDDATTIEKSKELLKSGFSGYLDFSEGDNEIGDLFSKGTNFSQIFTCVPGEKK